MAKLLKLKKDLPEDHKRYIPPTSKDGHIQGAVLVSDGVEVVEESQEDIFDVIEEKAAQVEKCIDITDIEEDDSITSEVVVRGEEEGEQVEETILGSGDGDSSLLVEEVGEFSGGSANNEGPQEATQVIPVY